MILQISAELFCNISNLKKMFIESTSKAIQTTAIRTVASSLPENEVTLLTLLISRWYVSCTDLQKISEKDWVEFIFAWFEATGKRISEEIAKEICNLTDRYSSYVQQLSWFVWLKTNETATEEDLRYAVVKLLDSCEPLFIQQTEDLSSFQMNFLRAIVEGVNTGFTQSAILSQYHLGTAANITRLKSP